MNDTLERALLACADEAIHVPGAIQPHGYLLALDPATFGIVQASENAVRRFGLALPAAAPCTPLDALFGEPLTTALSAAMRAESLERPLLLGSFEGDGEVFDAVVHASGGVLVVELEAVQSERSMRSTPVHGLARSFIAELRSGRSLQEMCLLAVREMRRLTGFGRVLVYRFDDDGHGEVLAEVADAGYASFAGHRFPASDIPPQARELYRRNPFRLIPDADYVPSPLLPAVNPLTGQPLDLSFATLRSVSPVHTRYMRNMGTSASMSVSVVVDDRLWGLISCHHAEPRVVPHATRLAAEHIGQLLAMQVTAQETFESAHLGAELRRQLVALMAMIGKDGGGFDALARFGIELLQFGGADGVAVTSDDRCALLGRTPDEAAVQALGDWLALHGDEVFASDRMPEVYAPAAAWADIGSGVLSLSVSKLHRQFVIWFRPEVPTTVQWAGAPVKAVSEHEGALPILHPRRSFETWREQVRGRSRPWHASQLAVAAEFRNALLNVVLRRAEEVAALAGELGRINRELQAFSYSVSHDLRAPLRHITGYADLLSEAESRVLSERGRRYIGNIREAARYAGLLVDNLLSFSQLGRSTLRPIDIDMNELVRGLVSGARVRGEGAGVEWRIDPLPTVRADPVFMQVAMQNLIGNAIKYSSRREPPRISISGDSDEVHHMIRVVDNGVGFDMRYASKLFGVFQRLHAVEDFEGTGIGLASARRAIERHGGRIEAFGEVDAGATFTIYLPRLPNITPGIAETETGRS